ncbi:hormone-sensitive lipase [Plectosphaerella plurivora]|uniref:Hormone-sensitive lipase n=1 Tax=Plectosphaerella plurivora TaxID=936078 RepID=A0A9P8V6I7_9PEZI|nr:hormone-sensitive lipase [Plectosphaerella plurivora]
MIDHVLGRPSVKSRRLQVLAVLAFWSAYIFKGHKHGPPLVRFFSRFWTKRLTAWQTVIVTMIYLYAARNFSTLVSLASPEPMANMYTTTFFRATWVLTAMDAGFWTAMKIRTKWLRDLSSVVFSVFYLVAAERADEKVRKIRSSLTVEHLRVSWNKGTTPYLRFLQGLVRPRLTRWPPRAIRIPRPTGSDYKDPVAAWLYYDGPVSDLERHTKVILDIPGGGFVAMDPRCNDDKLFAWAVKTGLPVLSLDYKKAPEYPYPYALNECFDVYTTIMKSKGRCLGMSGRDVPRVIMTGDSAGGNLATATTLMIIERTSPPMNRYMPNNDLALPDGLVLFYPALDMNIGNWMSDEQMSLIRDRSVRGTNRRIVRRKSMQYNELVGTPHPSEDEDDAVPPKAGAPPELDLSDVIEAATPPDGSAPASQVLPPRSPQPEYSHSGPQALSNTSTPMGGPPSTVAPVAAATPEDPTPKRQQSASHRPEPLRTRLAMSSMISYFNDRVLTPEMMRAMIILYIGPHNRPDFSQDYLLSPVLAPDALLARFPKTYFLTGERDPLVDDTVIFAARLRKVKEAQWRQARRAAAGEDGNDTDATATPRGPAFNDKDVAAVALLPGISHGFLQYPAVYPPAWGLIDRAAEWISDIYAYTDAQRAKERDQRGRVRRPGEPVHPPANRGSGDSTPRTNGTGRHHVRTATESSADDDRPLEMAMTSRSAKAKEKEKASGERRKSPPKTNGDRHQQPEEVEDNDEEADDAKPARKRNGRLRTGGLSMVKLKSSEDLLGRRMQGLAGGLTGVGEVE